jgi:transposase
MSLALQNMGKYCYIKESISFRDKQGRPRNHKVSVGKYDKETGLPTFNLSYLVKKRDKGENIIFKGQTYVPNDLIDSYMKSAHLTNLNTNECSAADTLSIHNNEFPAIELLNSIGMHDIIEQNVKNLEDKQILRILGGSKYFGLFYFLVNIGIQLNLLEILEKSTPEYWEEIYTLVMYTLRNSESYDKCHDWLNKNYAFDNIGFMQSQDISDLMEVISETEKNNFYKLWSNTTCENEYINIDITSIPTYSNKIDIAEFGHQKQKLSKNIKQINLCLLFGQKSFTPIYYTLYNGSLHDTKTLYFTVSRFSHIVENKNCLFVLDRGFFSDNNLSSLNNDNHKYLCAVPFTNSWARNLVEKYQPETNNPLKTIFTNEKGKPRLGFHSKLNISKANIGVHVHVYFNENVYVDNKNHLFEKIATIKNLIDDGANVSQYEDFIDEFFTITKIKGRHNKNIIIPNTKAINNELAYVGWSILVSNKIDDPQEAYDIYHNRDMVEKGFFKYKHVMNLDRLEVHNDIRANNKLFIVFLSLIIDRYVSAYVKNDKFLKRYNLDKILRIMETIKCSYNSNGELIVGPLTKEQCLILKAFNMNPPSYKCKWDKYNFKK